MSANLSFIATPAESTKPESTFPAASIIPWAPPLPAPWVPKYDMSPLLPLAVPELLPEPDIRPSTGLTVCKASPDEYVHPEELEAGGSLAPLLPLNKWLSEKNDSVGSRSIVSNAGM